MTNKYAKFPGQIAPGLNSLLPYTSQLIALAQAGYPIPPTLFKGQDLALTDIGLSYPQHYSFLREILSRLEIGRGLPYLFTITDAQVTLFADNQTLILTLMQNSSHAIDILTFEVKRTNGFVQSIPTSIVVDIVGLTTAYQIIDAFLNAIYNLGGGGLYWSFYFPLVQETGYVQLTMKTIVGMQLQNDPILFPIGGTAIGVSINVSISRIALSPFSALQQYTDNLQAVANDQIDGARGLTQVPGTLGTPAAIYDVAGLACDTKGDFDLDFVLHLASANVVGNCRVRCNGSIVGNDSADSLCMIAYPGAAVLVGGAPFCTGTYIGQADGDTINIHIRGRFMQGAFGKRQLHYVSRHHGSDGGSTVLYTGSVAFGGASEVDSVGVEVNLGTTFTAASSYVLTRRIAP